MTPGGSLTAEEKTLLDDLNNDFSTFMTSGRDSEAPFTNPDLKTYNDRIADMDGLGGKKAITQDFQTQFGLTDEEKVAIQEWAAYYTIKPDQLRTAVDKIPNFEGTVLRRTTLNAETLDMLVNFRAGSSGEAGVYNVRGKEVPNCVPWFELKLTIREIDLVVNRDSWDPKTGSPFRDLMATTPGLQRQGSVLFQNDLLLQ